MNDIHFISLPHHCFSNDDYSFSTLSPALDQVKSDAFQKLQGNVILEDRRTHDVAIPRIASYFVNAHPAVRNVADEPVGMDCDSAEDMEGTEEEMFEDFSCIACMSEVTPVVLKLCQRHKTIWHSPTIRSFVGQKIQRLRTVENLSRHKLARMADVDKNSIRWWEEGKNKPRLEKLKKVADALHRPMGYFFGDLPEEPLPLQPNVISESSDHPKLKQTLPYPERGKKITLAREERNLSEDDLAKLMDVRRETINSWECGLTFPRAKSLAMLAQKLGKPIDYF